VSSVSISTNKLTIGYTSSRQHSAVSIQTVVQSDLTFSLNEGEMVCMLGPNGCGKSTLLRTLAGLQPPLSGEYKLTAKSPYLQIVPQGKESSIFNLQYDIVVSNPPYICESEKSSMRRNVLEYEPATALFVPDSDPLRFYRRIAELKLGAYLFFEINEAYPAELSAMLDQLGYTDIRLTNDIYGKPRIIEARMVR
jgi:ATPase subunit of ABC transporter with duplicated ATPase domains